MADVQHSAVRARRGVAARPAIGSATSAEKKLPIFVKIFVISLIIPLIFSLGSITLSTYRIALLAMFVPSFIMWISGKAGPLRWADGLICLMVTWMIISTIYHKGMGEAIEPVGILTLEHLGTYLLGRVFIRDARSFRQMAILLFCVGVFLFPFALYEGLTGHNLYRSIWANLGRVPFDVNMEARLGLDRFQGPFDHPILSGVFLTPALALGCFVVGYRKGFVTRTSLTGIAFLTGFLSVSSGPISALTVQIGMVLWEAIFRPIKARWWIFLGLAAVAYVAIDLLSNRTPIVVAISYLALNTHTAMNRVYIWEWGWVNIFSNPLFGTGLGGEWQRYSFMTDSFDMFWLLYAMSYGLIAGIGHLGAALLIVWQLIRKKIADERIREYRMGWLIGFVGFFMAGWMVHYWEAPLALCFFFLGSAIWFLDYEDGADEAVDDTAEDTAERRTRYSRFPTRETRST
ncbi:MAG: hypothetical protein AAGA87_04255 [Pseudomonadota bacterium]